VIVRKSDVRCQPPSPSSFVTLRRDERLRRAEEISGQRSEVGSQTSDALRSGRLQRIRSQVSVTE